MTSARPGWYRALMRTNRWNGILVVAMALALAACGKKKDEQGGGGVSARPPKPADGTPLVAQFIELGKDKHGDLEAHFDLFSYADKDITRYQGTLHYLDAAGKELKTFPWGQQKRPVLVAKGGRSAGEGGVNIPPETKTVALTFDTVEFTDGSTWQAPAAP